MKPLFSIIIPVYNLYEELPSTIHSVLSQTYTDFEVVIIDDGSTDGSGRLIDSFSSDRIKVVHQQNKGVVAARYNGFCHSSGQWILFVDGDDAIVSNALEILADIIHTIKANIVLFGYSSIGADGVEKEFLPSLSGTVMVSEIISSTKRNPLEVLGMCIGNKCYMRNVARGVFEDVKDDKIARCEDGLFALAALFRSERITFLDKSLYRYYYRDSSASHSVNPHLISDYDRFIQRAVLLSGNCSYSSESFRRRMFDSLSREAIGFVFVECIKSGLSSRELVSRCEELKRCDYFCNEKSDWHPLERFIMRSLICHPKIFFLSRPMVNFLVWLKIWFVRRRLHK